MSNKLVSIIIPVYNIENKIQKCLESVCMQTYKNIEVIIVDDESSDRSGKIAKNFEKNDTRIKYYRKNNGGISSVRNFGVRVAHGDYIAFVDGDDYVDRDYIHFLVELLEQNHADISQCGHYIQYSKSRKVEKNKDHSLMILNRFQAMQSLCYEGVYDVTLWNKLFKRQIFHNICFPEGLQYEDTAVSYQIAQNATKFAIKMNSKYFYVQRYNSIANGIQFSNSKYDLIVAGDEMANFISEEYPSLAAAANAKRCFVRLSTLSQMVNAGYKDKTRIVEIKKFIWQHGNSVLMNSNVSLKTKLGICTLNVGFPLFAFIWKMKYMINRRG